MNSIDTILEYIYGSNDFVVTSHVNPDGDNIGSTLSIYYFLKQINKNVYYVMNDEMPLNMQFLIEDTNIINSNEFRELNIKNYNLIALDCGDSNRICIDDEIKNKCLKLINIDHHASNDFYGDLNYVISDASSTCELVYDILIRNEDINNTKTIDKKIATALYTGLMTDTGKLTYSNTHASSFDMAKNLLILGAETQIVVQNVFGSNPYNFYKLLGEALNTLEVVNTKIAIMIVTQDMLKKFNIDFKDIDGIVPYARDIKNVEVGILLKEKENNEIKVSLRSKFYADVSKIAKKFGGGGHIRAAGCTINDTIDNAKKKIIEETLKEI
ncbi:DHH family phosphoesterase [Terrisporobacter sp.]